MWLYIHPYFAWMSLLIPFTLVVLAASVKLDYKVNQAFGYGPRLDRIEQQLDKYETLGLQDLLVKKLESRVEQLERENEYLKERCPECRKEKKDMENPVPPQLRKRK
jgi:cell shape-determining protein MreC